MMTFIDVPVVLIVILLFLTCYFFLTKRKNAIPGPMSFPIIGNVMFFSKVKKSKKRFSVIMAEEEWKKYGDVIQLKFGSAQLVVLQGYDVIQEAFVRNAAIFSGRPHWIKQIEEATKEGKVIMAEEEWKKYGDVIQLKFGSAQLVVLQGYDVIQEAFVRNAAIFSGRPHWIKQIEEATKEGKGVIWQSGQDWKILRKFIITTLRDFGVGKTSLEDKIFLEIDSATDYLNQHLDKPADIRHVSNMMIGNVIYSIVFGKRFNFDDNEFHNILRNIDAMAKGLRLSSSKLQKLFLKLLDPEGLTSIRRREEALQFIKQLINKEIEKHETTFDNENIRDFIDLYVQAKTEKRNDEIFSVGNIFRVIIDLFFAGSETTYNTINWSILYMIEYPEVQKRCYYEIKEKYGDNPVTWSNKGTLMYVEATLLEIQRKSNIVDMAILHTNEVETTIRGFHIPKHSIIQANLYSVHMDERRWDRPHLFNPDRFIENGKLKKNAELIPFGIGPRVCLGESLAKMEIFLIFTNLVQRFHFSREDDNVPHTFETIKDQLTMAPIPYMARVKRRL